MKKMTTCPSEIHTYFVGINYESPDEDKGHFDIRRKVTIEELAIEVADYLENGKSSYQNLKRSSRKSWGAFMKRTRIKEVTKNPQPLVKSSQETLKELRANWNNI